MSGCERGQSTVEVVALLPVILAVGMAVAAVLSAGSAERAAGSAAEAGALAVLQEREPRQAVRAALEGWPRRSTRIRITGARVTVEVRPRIPVPSLARMLVARSSADAGPRSSPGPVAARGGDGFGAEKGVKAP